MEYDRDTGAVRAKLTVELTGGAHPAQTSTAPERTMTSWAWSLELTADDEPRRTARGELYEVRERDLPELLGEVIAEELRGLRLAHRPSFTEPLR